MTSITFHGGVKDIGGNKFLVEDKGTKVFMDFGMSFSKEHLYFSEFMKARGSSALTDMIGLGMLPNVKGLYRQDYAKHEEIGGDEETEISAVLLTHAHVDHCGYIKYLRPDIPIYCSEESKLIMQNFDDTGSGEQYLTSKKKFGHHEGTKNPNLGLRVRDTKDTEIARKVEVFESYKKFNIDSIEVEPLPVDHSIPGVNAFILHTSSGSIANTADLRFHGRRAKDTEKFVERCSESSLDLLLCEGTRIASTSSRTEFDVEDDIADAVSKTKKLAICGYPIRDLDRLQSFYLAAKKTGRFLVIDPKQAYLLKLFNLSPNLKGKYPSPTDKHIKVYMPKGEWGLIDKDLAVFTRKLLDQDYKVWAREFLDYDNMVDHRDVSKQQSELMFSLSDYKLQELLDIKPDDGSSYIRSLTEPFDFEMELKEEQIKNWFRKFGVISSTKDWYHFHVSGHGDGTQIKKVIDGSNAKKLVPIHTSTSKDEKTGKMVDNEDYHRKWHGNVKSVNQNDSVSI